MSVTLAFGPLRYSIEGVQPPPWLERHVVAPSSEDRRVCFEVVEVLRPATPESAGFGGFGYAVSRHGPVDHVGVLQSAHPAEGFLSALGGIVVRDAPSVEAMVVHAGALRIQDGVALLLGPSGVGKTTLVRASGARAFANNAVIARFEESSECSVWSLPFAGDPDPSLDAPESAPVKLLVELARGPRASFEWITASKATGRIVKSCVRPTGDDPFAARRARLSLALCALPTARLQAPAPPATPDALDALDEALRAARRPS